MLSSIHTFNVSTVQGVQMLGVKMLCANLEGAHLKGANFEDPAGSRANLEGLLGYYEYIFT